MNRKWLMALILGYSVAVAVSCVLPIGISDTEWYSFYSYLDQHGALPYVDVREGYPPLGFLVYMPLYYAFRGNAILFSYAFRALDGTFLVATLFTLYLIMKATYDEKKALKLSLYYAVLPSVFIANTYSNDAIALLPAAIAIYMIVRKKALPCGLLVGVAALCKGFPALLLIPAVLSFTGVRNKLKVIGAALLVIVFVSLPFMLLNPFTYLSTFTHVGSRGPWETIWAISDGYYSHGGLLHPFFDKFFYHFDLLKMYPASHYDHAIYAWNFDQLPNMLTCLQLAIIILVSLVYLERKKDTIPLCGLLYIGYMLFFKGYSTQFAVSTPFYVLLASTGTPLLFLIPLEISHIMQMLSWNSQAFSPEFLRNEHLPMLVSAVIIRTIVFAALIAIPFRSSRFGFKSVMCLGRRLVSFLKIFKDKWVILGVSATVVMALVSATSLYGYMDDPTGFTSFSGTISITQSAWQGLRIDNLEKGDQVMVRLATNTWLEAGLPNSTTQVEQGVRNPYNMKDSFNETMIFFKANSESSNLMLRMKHPKMPFRITEGLEKDLNVNVTNEDGGLMLRLHDAGVDGNASMFTMVYPMSSCVDDNFSLKLRYKLIEGNRSNIWIYLFDDTDEWLYPFAASEELILTSKTKDLYGYANLLGDNISLVELSMLVDDNSSAIIGLEELSVSSGEDYNVNFYSAPSEEVSYMVSIERDFRPTFKYVSALAAAVAFGLLAIFYLYRKAEYVERSQSSEN